MNYSELQTAIANTLDRHDLAAQIPTFIRLAEAQMDRELVVRQEYAQQKFYNASEGAQLPCDFAGVASLVALGQPNRPIVYLSPDMFDEQWLSSDGAPHYYTITKSQILFSPSAEFNGILRYWKRLSPLAEDNPTNWLLDRHPDAYLYGALTHAAPYLMEDSRIGVWSSFFTSAVAAINAESVAHQAGANVRIQNRGVV